MKNDAQILREFLTRYTDRVKKDQKAKGIYASGESAKSLREKVERGEGTDIRGVVTGRGYFAQQERGRGPTGNSSPSRPNLRQRIFEWLKVKSWSRGKSERERESLSYAITRKIHKRGTLRGRSTKYPGLDLTKILREEYGVLTKAVRNGTVTRVRSQIINLYKDVQNL